MRKCLRKVSIIVLILFIFISNCSLATTSEISDNYKEWTKLSEEEKEKTIQPSVYTLTIEDFMKNSDYSKATRMLSGTYKSSYSINEDVSYQKKNQETTNQCWAFATTTALETNMAKIRKKNVVLSPRHIEYSTSNNFLDGTNKRAYKREINSGGNSYISLAYCTSGNGPVLEADMPFENNSNKINLKDINIKPTLKLENYVQFPTIKKERTGDSIKYSDGNGVEYTEVQVQNVRNMIKEQIEKNGSVIAYTYIDNSLQNFNMEKYKKGTSKYVAYYNNGNKIFGNHAVSIIGWDDNFSKENFDENSKPIHDGAFLVASSSYLQDGTFSEYYISYDDALIEEGNFGITSTSDIDYDSIYQYDDYGYNLSYALKYESTKEPIKNAYISNVFNRNNTPEGKDEYLNEVSIYVVDATNVDIYVNANDDDKNKTVKVASAGILDSGYHTIKLSTPIKLTGNKFVIEANLKSDSIAVPLEANLKTILGQSSPWDNATSEKGQSYISVNGKDWNDLVETELKDSNVCLKGFTTYQDESKVKNVEGISLNESDKSMKKGESITLVSKITPNDATNKEVIWSSSNEEIAKVSDKGIVTAISEGEAVITAKTVDGEKVAECKIEVNGDIPKEDEVYYEDSKSPENSKPSTAVPTITITKTKDETTSNKILPKTGMRTILIITICGVIIMGILFIINRKMKDIK